MQVETPITNVVEPVNDFSTVEPTEGLSTAAKVGIGIGSIGAIGAVAYLLWNRFSGSKVERLARAHMRAVAKANKAADKADALAKSLLEAQREAIAEELRKAGLNEAAEAFLKATQDDDSAS